MEILETDLPEVKLLRPKRHSDERGYFVESWSSGKMANAGLEYDFVQDNQSLSTKPLTLRGMHWQVSPAPQTKLVRVLRGRILDIVVDIRPSSPTYLRHVAVELDDTRGDQLLVPRGFAHGFLTLEPETEVFYKVDAPYTPAAERGVHWMDPDLALPWPIEEGGDVIQSPRDAALPCFSQLGQDDLTF